MEDNEAEQSSFGSETDTLGSAYDTAANVADHALDNVGNMVDTDHDGAVLDDVMGWGATGAATIGGAAVDGFLGDNGALAGGAVGGLFGPEGALAGAAAGEMFGGAVGAAVGAAADYAGGAVGSMGEEYGDFMSDALGTRGELPYGDDECTDPDYKDGRQGSTDPDGGLGHQLNEYWNG